MQTTQTLETLARELRGELITPGDPAYDEARHVWNGMFDRRPVAIAQVQGAVDVVAVVAFARETGLELAVRGGGHSTVGHSTVDGGLVLDLSRMKGVWVDPQAKVAYAQAGALWGDVDRETQAHGLAVPGGQISHTGIAGLTLGGGIGWLSRQHGLTIDNLLSVDLVTADGRLVTASENENPGPLLGPARRLRQLRVAVSFEYRLHDVGPLVLGGPLLYELDDAPAAWRNARDFFLDAPDEVSLWLVLTHVPSQPPFPQEHWGTPVLAVVPFCTDLERGPALLEPLTAFGSPLANLHGPIPYTALQAALDDVDPHGHRYWERGDYLAEMSDDLIDVLVAGARTVSSKLTEILVFTMGGAIDRVPADATAFGDRSAPWAVWIASQWTDP
ncbi:MAG: FAD-binding oxidoreductase, partial [Gaiellaceae bacterium]